MPKRGDVYWVNLDPTIGSETKKTRPALIVSNDAQNQAKSRYIIAPITSQIKKLYPFEALIAINDKQSKAMLDQIRAIDARRLGRFITTATTEEIKNVDRALKLVLVIQ